MPTHHLWILRHARAEPAGFGMRDQDRPLAAAGRQACAHINSWLQQSRPRHLPQQVLVSPALRTVQTARLALAGLGLDCVTEPRLWEASAGELQALLGDQLARHRDLMVVAHNPGLEGLARLLGARLPSTGLSPGTLVILQLALPLQPGQTETLQVLPARESM
ncbi:MAG: histidine phosphatase family protein [Wenzhouxiangella sp.]|nr:histidine phosphatase family protein [Wenzhouxiangella sp.]MCH8477635.1 histidine phosphatase family protein [Wenzhouxiangella sp.]